MLCRVEQPSHEALYGRFYRWRMFHGGGSAMGLIGMPIVVAVAAFAMLGFGTNWVLVAALLAVAAGYYAYALWYKPTALYRKKSGVALQSEVYLFTENSFTRSVRNEEGGAPDNTSAQYSALVRAVETAKDFYLFTGPNQAYLVDKEYFTKGDPKELRAMLHKALGTKFLGKNKQKGE